MTEPAVLYAREICKQFNGQVLSEDGHVHQLSDDADDAIAQIVRSLSKVQLFELIWTTQSVHDLLVQGDHISDIEPQHMLRNIAEVCIQDAVLEMAGIWAVRSQALVVARARRATS